MHCVDVSALVCLSYALRWCIGACVLAVGIALVYRGLCVGRRLCVAFQCFPYFQCFQWIVCLLEESTVCDVF
jgi:hypothetical protein